MFGDYSDYLSAPPECTDFRVCPKISFSFYSSLKNIHPCFDFQIVI